MNTAERIKQSLVSRHAGPDVSTTGPTSAQRSLITEEPWDAYRLESLLPLKETYRENREFGFLLRHYWIPATELTFRQSSRLTLPDGTIDRQETIIERRMARCRSNECMWREKVFLAGANNAAGNGSEPAPPLGELLCSYNCYEQTFHSAPPILFAPLAEEQKVEARWQALYCLPVIVPPGPVPLGFCWYAKVGDDYMNYRLESEEQLGETSVLVIRRKGRFTVRVPSDASGKEGEVTPATIVIGRQGVTLFAWNRSVVLEDRIMDCVVEANGSFASHVGATKQFVVRLVRSCPTEVASPQKKPPAESQCCP